MPSKETSPKQNNQQPETRGLHSLQLDQAERNARLSKSFMSLMKDQGIQLVFPPVSSDGVCAADATQNPTHAYKVRGALASAELAQQEGKTTLVTASAGNHGAGLAYAAQQLGLKALIYVPKTLRSSKLRRSGRLGLR